MDGIIPATRPARITVPNSILNVSAMINGPDNKGYTIKVGDKVLDGEIIRITPTSVVFRQQVNDPTRIERYREVVKDLAPTTPRR